jgi:hypothetical protein
MSDFTSTKPISGDEIIPIKCSFTDFSYQENKNDILAERLHHIDEMKLFVEYENSYGSKFYTLYDNVLKENKYSKRKPKFK